MPKEYIPIKIGNKSRTLKFTYNALAELEDLGYPISEIGEKLASSVSLKVLRALVWAGLLHEKSGLSPEDIGEQLELSQIGEIAQAVGDALAIAFPPVEAVSKNLKSQVKDEKAKAGTGTST